MTVALDVLKQFGRLRLRAWGESMLPSVWPGDVLTLKRCRPEQLKRGEIVLYRRGERLFIHRVTRIREAEGERWVVTQGDATPHSDPPVAASQVLGCVTNIARGARGVCRTRWGRAPQLASFLFRRAWSSRVALRVHAWRRSMTF
ncbi:MAG: signal peptidase I [Acidobacteriia bacterium]|nr:signal peptidase I [Terriglobia bacterium]